MIKDSCLVNSDILWDFFEGKILNFQCIRLPGWLWIHYFEFRKAQANIETHNQTLKTETPSSSDPDDRRNKKFDLTQFRELSIRKVYDSLHGISGKAIPLSNAVEIMAYCLVDGKVKQESVFETNLYNELVEQLRAMKARFSLKYLKKVK